MATEQVNYSADFDPDFKNMSPRKAAKMLMADTIEVREVKNDNGPKYCFLLIDGVSVGQASKSIRENVDANGDIIFPKDPVISRLIPKDGSKPFYILHPQGAGKVTTLFDANAANGESKNTTLL